MFIKRRRNWYVLMQEAGDGGAGGGAGGAGGDGGAAAAAAAAAAASAAEGGEKGTPASVLAAGATGGEPATDFIPDKYRVNKDDGSFDMDASARKLAEAYGNAEKRIGSGDIPPKAAAEYTVTVPDAFKETWKPEEDAGFAAFRDKAHAAGLTQKQLDVVMGQYFEMAPQLVAGAAVLDANACTSELKKTWATEADFNRNVGNAFAAATAIAGKAGIEVDAIMAGPLGNNPTFLKLMAALGPELKEDQNPNGDGPLLAQDEITDLMMSEAYTNSNHKDHAKVSAQVRKYYEKKHGTEAAA